MVENFIYISDINQLGIFITYLKILKKFFVKKKDFIKIFTKIFSLKSLLNLSPTFVY